MIAVWGSTEQQALTGIHLKPKGCNALMLQINHLPHSCISVLSLPMFCVPPMSTFSLRISWHNLGMIHYECDFFLCISFNISSSDLKSGGSKHCLNYSNA